MQSKVAFNEIKNRDAWSTLRGFVYQVDKTLQRWLLLQQNEVLELERGEDIDIVTCSTTWRKVKYHDSSNR
jgi:hypothetical protein